MENQHNMITGYRDLTIDEINAMNYVKDQGQRLEHLIDEMLSQSDLDQRWVSIGATHLQQGIMALVRAIAKPESF